MVILKTISGFVLLAIGFGLCYLYLKNIDNSTMALLLIPSFCIIILGIFVLIHAGKSDESVMQKQKIAENETENADAQKTSLLEKNNAMTQNWLKSVEKRDKMKLLQMVASEEEASNKS